MKHVEEVTKSFPAPLQVSTTDKWCLLILTFLNSADRLKRKISNRGKIAQKKGRSWWNKQSRSVIDDRYVSQIPKHKGLRADTLIHSLKHLYLLAQSCKETISWWVLPVTKQRRRVTRLACNTKTTPWGDVMSSRMVKGRALISLRNSCIEGPIDVACLSSCAPGICHLVNRSLPWC